MEINRRLDGQEPVSESLRKNYKVDPEAKKKNFKTELMNWLFSNNQHENMFKQGMKRLINERKKHQTN